MKKPSKKQPGTDNNPGEAAGGWLTTLSTLFKPLAIAAAASLASIFAYVTTPLNEYVNTFFWDEKAEILLISQNPNIRALLPIEWVK
jgi:hypothetical protein